jgi:hypothetical protein
MIPNERISEIRESLNTRTEEVCRHLLPSGNRINKGWRCGGLDGTPGESLEVELEGPKVGVFLDRATGDAGDILTLWQKMRNCSFQDAVDEAAEFLGMPPRSQERPSSSPPKRLDPSGYEYTAPAETHLTKPEEEPEKEPMPPPPEAPKLDWDSCLMDFTDAHAEALCKDRGFSRQFVAWLHEQEAIGIYKGCIAFPVHNDKGEVVRIHFKGKDHWQYYPKGGETAPMIIGDPLFATDVLAFESQWDAFAILDKLHAHLPENASRYCAYITRGATSNTDLSKLAIPKLIACPQNDPPEKKNKTTGRTPAEEWLFRIQGTKQKKTSIVVFENPEEYEDANAWTLGDNPNHFDVFRMVIEGAKNPLLKDLSTTDEILAVNIEDDPSSMIGFEGRFLGRGGSLLFVGPSGIGKSTLTTSFGLHAAAGAEWHGITFRKPLKVLVVQAENDKGDLSEMVRGALTASGFDQKTQALARKNVVWIQEPSRTGADFCQWLEKIIVEVGADMVIVDPLLSYVGDDISQQKVASAFLRNGLQPIMNRTGVIMIIVHHTGKPLKDPNALRGWSDSDFAYLGLGSSDTTNWARAVAVFTPWGVNSGIFRLLIAKRGKRAGMVDAFTGQRTTSIFLKHAGHGLGWDQCKPPDESEAPPRGNGRKQSLTADQVMKELGDGSQAVRKDMLIAGLALKHKISDRTVREKLDQLILFDRAHVSSEEPRPGGGKPIAWIRTGPQPKGNNQTEASN